MTVKRPLLWIGAGLSLFTVGYELLEKHGRLEAHGGAHHAAYWWHSLIGFELVFGLAAAVLLAVCAKLILFPLIVRNENYYGERS